MDGKVKAKAYCWQCSPYCAGRNLFLINSPLSFETFTLCFRSRSVLVQNALQGCAFLCLVGAITAVFTSHIYHAPPFSNLQTAHSWFGVITLTFFAVQVRVRSGTSPTQQGRIHHILSRVWHNLYFLIQTPITALLTLKVLTLWSM